MLDDRVVITEKLPSVTDSTQSDSALLIEHTEWPLVYSEGICSGDIAFNIRRVTYMGIAGTQICTCSRCGRLLILPEK